MKISKWERLKPAVALIFLAPLIAEYLLGSLSFQQLVLFPIMMPMYGAGALFVREWTRRNGRGWPTIITLGLAFALIEEGLAAQSLFNPHYLGLDLLEKGFIPSLGIAGPWTTYVLILHAAWSIAVPIALVEALFSPQRTTPWLKRPGLAVCGVVYFLGVALIAFGTWQKEHFAASTAELVVTVLLTLAVAAVAFVLFRRHPDEDREALPSWKVEAILGVGAFLAGSMFHLAAQFGGIYFSPVIGVMIELVIPISLVIGVSVVRNTLGWTAAYNDALMLGGLSAYCWLGFFLTARLHGPDTIAGQFFPFLIVAALIGVVIFRRARLQKTLSSAEIGS